MTRTTATTTYHLRCTRRQDGWMLRFEPTSARLEAEVEQQGRTLPAPDTPAFLSLLPWSQRQRDRVEDLFRSNDRMAQYVADDGAWWIGELALITLAVFALWFQAEADAAGDPAGP